MFVLCYVVGLCMVMSMLSVCLGLVIDVLVSMVELYVSVCFMGGSVVRMLVMCLCVCVFVCI